jgi:hypothetical protein
VGHNVAGAQQG